MILNYICVVIMVVILDLIQIIEINVHIVELHNIIIVAIVTAYDINCI